MDLNNIIIPNQIIKSKRKSISLIIKNGGEFVVRAPINCSNKKIEEFIKQKSKWIIEKRQAQIACLLQPLNVLDGEKIYILGKEYLISLSEYSRVKIKENSLSIPSENSKEKLITFLKKQAKKYFQIKTNDIAEKFGFKFEKISISSAKTCWGSCSAKNNIHFTYKLIMCPEEVVEYIIIHELCHTKEKNHSKKFWLLVENCCPKYKSHEKWLKDNRSIVYII